MNLRAKILNCLLRNTRPMSANMIRKSAKARIELIESALAMLERSGAACSTPCHQKPDTLLWSRTMHTQRRLDYELAPTQAAASRSIAPPKELYQPIELAEYTGRPGAMDAHKLPSLISGQRVWPKRQP